MSTIVEELQFLPDSLPVTVRAFVYAIVLAHLAAFVRAHRMQHTIVLLTQRLQAYWVLRCTRELEASRPHKP